MCSRHSGSFGLSDFKSTAQRHSNVTIAMEDEIIVVDNDPNDTSYNFPPPLIPQAPGPSHSRPTRSDRRAERASQSAKAANSKKILRLKLGDKTGGTSGTSFLGAYDRELDSDDEDLAFEEQFILRMPEGEDCERLRKMVQARDVSDDVWFKFKGMRCGSAALYVRVLSYALPDSRRAVFHIGTASYSAKLVDLPCIIEAQKTLDNRQMFKVADICQMIVVDDKKETEDTSSNHKTFHIDDFIWPHGITPPLKHVRQRRFRKRVNKNVAIL